MNEHILFVIDHLANPGKYTQEELKANFESVATYCATATYYAADAVGWAADVAAYYAADCDGSRATYWVDEYFKSTGEDKQTYIDALGE
jgi:hypothetical protein